MLSKFKEACEKHGWLRAEVLELFKSMEGAGVSELPEKTTIEEPVILDQAEQPLTILRTVGWSGNIEDADTSNDEAEAQRLLEEAYEIDKRQKEVEISKSQAGVEHFSDVEITEVCPLSVATELKPLGAEEYGEALSCIEGLFVAEIIADSDTSLLMLSPSSPPTPRRALSFGSSSQETSRSEDAELDIQPSAQTEMGEDPMFPITVIVLPAEESEAPLSPVVTVPSPISEATVANGTIIIDLARDRKSVV